MSGAQADTIELWAGKDRGDENFPVASILIAPRLRPHVHAYYAFARNADDIADHPDLAAADKIARLDRMDAILNHAAQTGSPSALRLRDSLAETKVGAAHATDLLVAFRQDATKLRYADWDELIEYCRYSAVPVGRYVLELHGEGPITHAPSNALCTSLQILNHIQDASGDLATLNRCYLPEDLLRHHGANIEDLRAGGSNRALREVFDTMLDQVHVLNLMAAPLPGCVRDWRLRLECGVIVNLAQRLTERLRAEDPVAGRVKLSRVDMALCAVKALRHLA